MTFAYNPNVPNPPNNPSVDVGDMHTNAQSIQSIIGVDHITFNSGSNQGTHSHVTFTTPSTTPTLGANQAQIYINTSSNSNGLPETYLSATINGAAAQLNGYLPFVKGMYTFNPTNGSLISGAQSFNVTSVVKGNVGLLVIYTVTFTTPLPANGAGSTGVYQVYAQQYVASPSTTSLSQLQISSKTANSFVISGVSSSATSVSFMVI